MFIEWSDKMSAVHKKIYNQIRVISYLTRFVTRAFLISILCLLVIFSLVITCYLGDILINGKSENSSPLFSTYVIVSPSMVPTIKINDAIVVQRVDNDNYNIGDIITFASNDMDYKDLMITHRIVDKENVSYKNSIYTTKGDNNLRVDPTSVQTNAINGRVLFKIPKVGYVKDFFSKPINYCICLLIPAVIFIVYNALKIMFAMYKKKVFSI